MCLLCLSLNCVAKLGLNQQIQLQMQSSSSRIVKCLCIVCLFTTMHNILAHVTLLHKVSNSKVLWCDCLTAALRPRESKNSVTSIGLPHVSVRILPDRKSETNENIIVSLCAKLTQSAFVKSYSINKSIINLHIDAWYFLDRLYYKKHHRHVYIRLPKMWNITNTTIYRTILLLCEHIKFTTAGTTSALFIQTQFLRWTRFYSSTQYRRSSENMMLTWTTSRDTTKRLWTI